MHGAVRWLSLLAVVVSLASRAYAAPAPAADSSRAVAAEYGHCIVCAVLHGEAEDEPVRAHRMHQGRRYGFCSEKCAQAFADDPQAFLTPEYPYPAPGFTLRTLAGAAVSLDSLRGHVVLLDFWATWCAPCRRSMPELQALHDRHAAQGLTVLGVSIDENADAKVRRFVRTQRFTYPIAIDGGTTPAWQAYHVKAIPAVFLIDRVGRVVAQWTGGAPPTAELAAAIERALADAAE